MIRAASFTYTVDDGVGGVSQASVAITFDPVNDAPVPDAARMALLFAQYAVLPPANASDGSTVFVSAVPDETTDAWLAAAAASSLSAVAAVTT